MVGEEAFRSAVFPVHGGDLADAEARFGAPAEGWLDLSTGINPWPYPMPPAPASAHARLPDAADYRRLRNAAARYFGAPDPGCVALGSGSQAFIQLLPNLVPRGRVAILSPTYAPHAEAWRAAGHEVEEVGRIEQFAGSRHAVVVSPNNPDGRRFNPSQLFEVTARSRREGSLLVIDEAFADCTPDLSAAARLEEGVVVLRSFGKFFGLAGLRLGFALADPALAARLRQSLGSWPVSGHAIIAGIAALQDDPWIAATRLRLAEAACALDSCLTRNGLTVLGGTDLFRLCEHADAEHLWQALGRLGILVRAFAFNPRWLRIGLPPDPQALSRLESGLRTGLGDDALDRV